jgi:hypothetical protein
MELVHNYQVSFNELLTEKFDYIIAASGYQKRSTYLAENVNTSESENLAIAFNEPANSDLRLENEQLFQKLGFNSIRAAPNESSEIERMMHKICSGKVCSTLNILVDYSCMTKVWCATIIKHLLKNDFHAERINIYFSYTPKKVNSLFEKSRLKSYNPLIFSGEKSLKNKPVALIAGLNSNHEVIKEFIDEIKPVKTFAFVPYFLHDSEYYQKIVENNAPVLKNIPSEMVLKYPAQRPDQISSMITSLCLDLRLDSNVILVPQGPKTFILASILLSVRYPDVVIYDLKSKVSKTNKDQGLPAGEPVILKSVFCIEED